MTTAAVLNLRQEISYDNITCCTCGIVFWVPAYFKEKRISDKKDFWCPNGHMQAYVGESDAAKAARLAREKFDAETRARMAWDQADKLSKANARLRKPAKAGVCPCCKRTFRELAAHMKQKHPDFK